MAKTINMNIDFSEEDMKFLHVLRKAMENQQGRVSWAAVIRAAIRKAAAK